MVGPILRSFVLRHVEQNEHIIGVVGPTPIVDEEFPNVADIIVAAAELVVSARVVDTD